MASEMGGDTPPWKDAPEPMLDGIAGKLLESDQDYAVVDVNGLRFRADIPASTAGQLPPVGNEVSLLVRLTFNPNEGVFALFGFATEMERECYDILLTMSGIGPRKAMLILSQIEIASFANAIVQGDVNYVSKIKGVGKKTAERLIVELREKMAPLVGAGGGTPTFASSAPQSAQDAMAGLMALGCRPAVAEKAVRIAIDIIGESATVSELIREALKHR